MKHIKEYAIERKKSHFELEDRVQKLINEGWQPFGSLSSFNQSPAPDCNNIVHYQAMVKYSMPNIESPLLKKENLVLIGQNEISRYIENTTQEYMVINILGKKPTSYFEKLQDAIDYCIKSLTLERKDHLFCCENLYCDTQDETVSLVSDTSPRYLCTKCQGEVKL